MKPPPREIPLRTGPKHRRRRAALNHASPGKWTISGRGTKGPSDYSWQRHETGGVSSDKCCAKMKVARGIQAARGTLLTKEDSCELQAPGNTQLSTPLYQHCFVLFSPVLFAEFLHGSLEFREFSSWSQTKRKKVLCGNCDGMRFLNRRAKIVSLSCNLV